MIILLKSAKIFNDRTDGNVPTLIFNILGCCRKSFQCVIYYICQHVDCHTSNVNINHLVRGAYRDDFLPVVVDSFDYPDFLA